MKFNQYIWGLYKESSAGKDMISYFQSEDTPIYDLIKRFNPKAISHLSKDIVLDTIDCMWDYSVSKHDVPNSIEEAALFYENFITNGIEDGDFSVVDKNDYKTMLSLTSISSTLLYFCASEYFIPYLFLYRFYDLNNVMDLFEIEQPPLPKKSVYQARCMYYMELCKVFYNFRITNNLTPAELCAFLYDFAINQLPKPEMREMPQPSQVWFIGGKIQDFEKGSVDFWQANKETKRGDIMVHYETSPISAITHIWRAQTDGVVDPFFQYYSNSYVSQGVEVSHISLAELKADDYFKGHSLVNKSFQGVNGWALSSDDYARIKLLLSNKGYVGCLPDLYYPALPNVNIKLERDVEVQLLEYYLSKMGYVECRDYIRQLPIHAGRGSRIYPDYALHYDSTPDYETAKVLIEVKLYMKSVQDVEECFKQAYSYAKILESKTIVLCDKERLIVYQKEQSFNRYKYKTYYWGELDNSDRFNELKMEFNY